MSVKDLCLCNKNTFLNYLLVLLLLNLVVLYVYQNLDYYCNYFDIKGGICKNKNNFHNLNNNLNFNENKLNSNNGENNLNNNLDNNLIKKNTVKTENKDRLKNNNIGAKGPFHEKFKKKIPELGWRKFYLKNYGGIDNVCELDKDCSKNFKGVITKNFLNNMKNVDNIYKNVDY